MCDEEIEMCWREDIAREMTNWNHKNNHGFKVVLQILGSSGVMIGLVTEHGTTETLSCNYMVF